jgi:hypothetical protein
VKPINEPNSTPSLSRKITWGLRWGSYIGVAFSIQALLVVALTGGPDLLQGAGLVYLIIGYLFFGALGGIVVGVCRGRVKSAVAAISVAFAATWPFAFFLFVTYDKGESITAWLPGATVISGVWSVIGGPMLFTKYGGLAERRRK